MGFGSVQGAVDGIGGTPVDPTSPGGSLIDLASEVTGVLLDESVAESNVTQHAPAIDHDALTNFDITEHRIINDAGTSTIETWSASKIDSEIGTLSAGLIKKAGVKTTTFGVGNITLSGEQTLNGFPTNGSRVLVVEQTLPEENGIYDTAASAWARAPDADGTPSNEVANGNTLEVLDSGSTDFKSRYTLVTADPITVGTTGQAWERHPDIDFGTTSGTATEGNDTRVPTQDENNALGGTNGVPSTSNKYVTNSDPRNTDDRNDADAIHDNVAGEIAALAQKASPIAADHVLIEDSANSNVKKRVAVGVFLGGGITAIETSFPLVITTNAVYEDVLGGRFRFVGTTKVGTPSAIVITGGMQGTATGSYRIQDITNTQTIAEVTGVSAADPASIDLGTLSNLPAAPAIFQLQFKRDTGSGGSNVPAASSISLDF